MDIGTLPRFRVIGRLSDETSDEAPKLTVVEIRDLESLLFILIEIGGQPQPAALFAGKSFKIASFLDFAARRIATEKSFLDCTNFEDLRSLVAFSDVMLLENYPDWDSNEMSLLTLNPQICESMESTLISTGLECVEWPWTQSPSNGYSNQYCKRNIEEAHRKFYG